MTQKSLIERDRACTWHPYTQHGLGRDPMEVASAKDATLTLTDGREVIDAISSWWAILHGHGDPVLIEAARQQFETLDHVLFAGATHEPAVRLAERLVEVTPEGLDRVFYSDNGSTAVEVALKIALQNFAQNGQPERQVFIALKGAYHGDTFGSMSVGDPDPFFEAYKPFLFNCVRIDPTAEALQQAFEQLGGRAAGVIVEPLIQGAAGMRTNSVEFLQSVRQQCDRNGVPFIADEVMTGFGRTGSLFACERAGVSPDLMCLAKGLTGGIFPLSATVVSDELFQGFFSKDRNRTFFHGHTFTAHPVGCAVALASLKLNIERRVPDRLQALGERMRARLQPLETHPGVSQLRQVGGMVAWDLVGSKTKDAGYLSQVGPALHQASLDLGVLLRPLGNVVYALPPACTTDAQADQIADTMLSLAERFA
ncbi:MAG: adenosylmethionine-8-amino-7-oxononanoate aminotransferase [Glaciecola sp.]|jgi:adenosylmethionine-8-amino-7-oxononanoate aminotransferase